MTTRSATRSVLALLLAFGLQDVARAGTYGDDFGKCLVRSSTDADKHALVEWIFAAISLNPDIAAYANLPSDTREAIYERMGKVFERLVGEACRTEASEALKYEGPDAFGIAFRLLGQVAGQQVFASPEVTKGSEAFLRHVDVDALQRKLGIPPDAK